MKRILFAALAAAVFCGDACAADAPAGALRVTLYADRAADYLDASTGEAHAFMCLTPAQAEPGAAAAKPECFGLYPRGTAITAIQLSDGDALVKREDGWLQTPGGYRYEQIQGPADNVVLYDAARALTWTLSIPRGGSIITRQGKTSPWSNVESVGFAAQPVGFIGGDWANSDFQERPKPWNEATLKFSMSIDASRRTDLLSIIHNWNSRAVRLTPAEITDLLDAMAATIGARRPARVAGETAGAYVDALIRINTAARINPVAQR